ncbi:MAG: single-stranded DNA-binding protein [Planctomycetota bacterium JB042]
MTNLNKVFLMGRLTRDPEQRFISSGQAVTNLGVAINRTFTTNGEKREETTFVDVEAWGQRGDLIAKYLKKGNPIFIEGRLKFDTWESKEGEKRSKLRVVLDNFQFIGGGAQRTDSQEEQLDPSHFGIDPSGGGAAEAGGGGDDVPF